MKSKLAVFLLLLIPVVSFAWDGHDQYTGTIVEIDDDYPVRPGLSITFYDEKAEDLHVARVESIRSYAASFEIEVYDYAAEEYKTFGMDGD